MQYNRYSFNSSEAPVGQLDSAEELDLIYWLDFLNAVSIAVVEKLLTDKHLRGCTLGYAIDMTLKNKSVLGYLEHVRQYDATRKTPASRHTVSVLPNIESFKYLWIIKKRYDEYDRRYAEDVDRAAAVT